MNIFYLDSNPRVCAEMHNDKHVVKMILEYAQLLSTAHRILDGVPATASRIKSGRQYTCYNLSDNRDAMLYSTTHINHPSAIWVRQSEHNYNWLAKLLIELCSEYTYRYGKIHKVYATGLANMLYIAKPKNIPKSYFTEPTPAMPDEYKANDSIQSYRNYYLGAKSAIAAWKNREKPTWFI